MDNARPNLSKTTARPCIPCPGRINPDLRTELVLAGHRTDEAHWQERRALARTESTRYIGRAVAALAADAERNTNPAAMDIYDVSAQPREFITSASP